MATDRALRPHQDEVAKLVHKSRSHIANLLRLLELPDPSSNCYCVAISVWAMRGRSLTAEDPESARPQDRRQGPFGAPGGSARQAGEGRNRREGGADRCATGSRRRRRSRRPRAAARRHARPEGQGFKQRPQRHRHPALFEPRPARHDLPATLGEADLAKTPERSGEGARNRNSSDLAKSKGAAAAPVQSALRLRPLRSLRSGRAENERSLAPPSGPGDRHQLFLQRLGRRRRIGLRISRARARPSVPELRASARESQVRSTSQPALSPSRTRTCRLTSRRHEAARRPSTRRGSEQASTAAAEAPASTEDRLRIGLPGMLHFTLKAIQARRPSARSPGASSHLRCRRRLPRARRDRPRRGFPVSRQQ
jgi:hypothetical protein